MSTSSKTLAPRAKVAFDSVALELVELRELVAELHQKVRARDDFIAIAAHELRNPMTPIVGVAELALMAACKAEGACPPRVTELLERMQHLLQNYIRRATTLLDVSRIEAGNMRLEPDITDLSAVVLLVAQRYSVTAALGGNLLELDLEDTVTGVWDPLAVEQVVENLLSNALKFGLDQPVTLRLRSHEQSAWIEVQDRGAGIQPDQQSRIFGKFEQAVIRHRGSGFGVGLWVTNRLVMAMNGQISVSSSLGMGSTFTVMLPLEPPSIK